VKVSPSPIETTSAAFEGLMPSQGNAKYVNEAGGNIYGDSRINWEANPALNHCANPSLSPMGCR